MNEWMNEWIMNDFLTTFHIPTLYNVITFRTWNITFKIWWKELTNSGQSRFALYMEIKVNQS